MSLTSSGTAGQTTWWRWRESNPRPKDSTTKLYERSLPIVVTAVTPAGWLPCSHLLVFRTVSRIVCGTPPLSRPTRCPVENGTGGRGLVKETGLSRRSLMQRGAWQRTKCGWHLKSCAEFTRSAPLGSHSGTSLSRRSLSSPGGRRRNLRVAFPMHLDYSIPVLEQRYSRRDYP